MDRTIRPIVHVVDLENLAAQDYEGFDTVIQAVSDHFSAPMHRYFPSWVQMRPSPLPRRVRRGFDVLYADI